MYYLFTSPEGDAELHYDASTRRATNMRNGKSTILSMGIDEWAALAGFTLVRKSESFQEL